MVRQRFRDRIQAGDLLGAKLKNRTWQAPVVVLALPRGGLPVGARVAEALGAPLDVLVVRKIGAPAHEELACGAIAPSGVVVWNEGVLRTLGLTPADLSPTIHREELELLRRESAIRSTAAPPLPLKDLSVIVVDDGIATGATMRAAIRAVKRASPRELIVALPVGPMDSCHEIAQEERCVVVCLREIPSSTFGSVGEWYEEFSQVETEECRDLLAENRKKVAVPGSGALHGIKE